MAPSCPTHLPSGVETRSRERPVESRGRQSSGRRGRKRLSQLGTGMREDDDYVTLSRGIIATLSVQQHCGRPKIMPYSLIHLIGCTFYRVICGNHSPRTPSRTKSAFQRLEHSRAEVRLYSWHIFPIAKVQNCCRIVGSFNVAPRA